MDKYTEVEGIDASTYAGKAALAVKKKARGIMGDELLIFTLVDFVSYMMINNKFLNKGIVITDDTKEEGYIKIIETGDETLITELERFIELRDKIQEIETKKNEYQDIIGQLKRVDSNDSDAINGIVEAYLRR